MNTEKYIELCNKLDEIFGRENPCHFVEGECIAARNEHLKGYDSCCRRCLYLIGEGCSIKCLGCKLYFCLIAWSRISQKGKNEIESIRLQGMANGFSGIIGEKEI